jgi:hypothetical protein
MDEALKEVDEHTTLPEHLAKLFPSEILASDVIDRSSGAEAALLPAFWSGSQT